MPAIADHLAGRRVLVVEDEYLIAMALKRWLQDEGADVVGPVPSVEQALDLIENEDALDAAVLDLNLGDGETAYPIADRLAVLRVPFLIVSGDVRASRPAVHPDRPCLAKPILASELIRSLDALIADQPTGAS